MSNKVLMFDETTHERYNTNGVKHYGEVVYVFPRGRARTGIFATAFSDELINRLQELKFNPASDYLCVSGTFAPILFLALNIFEHYDCVNLLVFNSVHGDYTPKTFKRKDSTKCQ